MVQTLVNSGADVGSNPARHKPFTSPTLHCINLCVIASASLDWVNTFTCNNEAHSTPEFESYYRGLDTLKSGMITTLVNFNNAKGYYDRMAP